MCRLHIPSLAEFACVNKSNQSKIYHQTHPYHSPPLRPLPQQHNSIYREHIEPEEDNNSPLKQTIEQCTMIHKEITRYRMDPLTEADRNKIIELIYYTTDSVINSLKTLDDQLFSPNESEDCSIAPSSSSLSLTQHEEVNSNKYEMIRQARNLQDSTLRPKYRRRNKRSMIGQRCHSCNTTETPEWRRGPDGARTLCNACGLRKIVIILLSSHSA
ncbi:hypothetical protein G6F56_005897 [Rhizopus delemar]|nr:hypothetical protein G6F56_005897 [Rhizopus delemar]